MKSFVVLPVAFIAVVAASLPAHAWFLPGELNLERTTSPSVAAYQAERIEAPQAGYAQPAAEWDAIF